MTSGDDSFDRVTMVPDQSAPAAGVERILGRKRQSKSDAMRSTLEQYQVAMRRLAEGSDAPAK